MNTPAGSVRIGVVMGVLLAGCGGGSSGPVPSPGTAIENPGDRRPVEGETPSGITRVPRPLEFEPFEIETLTVNTVGPYLDTLIELLALDDISLAVRALHAIEPSLFIDDPEFPVLVAELPFDRSIGCPGGGRVDTQYFVPAAPELGPSHRFEDCSIDGALRNSSYSHLISDSAGYAEQSVSVLMTVDGGGVGSESITAQAERARLPGTESALPNVAFSADASYLRSLTDRPFGGDLHSYDLDDLQYVRSGQPLELSSRTISAGWRVSFSMLRIGLPISRGWPSIVVTNPVPFSAESSDAEYSLGQLDATATRSGAVVYRLSLSADTGDPSTVAVTFDNGPGTAVQSLVIPWSETLRFKEPQVAFDTPP